MPINRWLKAGAERMSLLLEVADSAKGTSGPKKTLYRDLVIGMSYLKEMAP